MFISTTNNKILLNYL